MAPQPKNILVIKLRYIGDVLLSTPILRALRTEFPKARLTVVVNPGTEAVLHRNPHVDEVLSLQRHGWLAQLKFLSRIRSRQFDCVVDLTDGDRAAILTAWSGAPIRIGFNHERRWTGLLYTWCLTGKYGTMHMVDYHAQLLQGLGLVPKSSDPELFVGEEEERAADRHLDHVGLSGQPWVMMFPFARYRIKAWPADRFAALGDALMDRGYPVVLIGAPPEQQAGEEIQRLARHELISFIGRTSLRELAALMKRSVLFVGNDGGPMHMAAAAGCPVVGIFWPTDPAVWGPRGSQSSVLYKGLDCRQCFHPDCFRGEESCLKQISVEEVRSAVLRFLLPTDCSPT